MSILAIDFGGTRTRAGWFSPSLELLARHENLSRVERPVEAVIQTLIDTARQVIPQGASPQAIGICAPGPMDANKGIIHHAATLPNWSNVPLASHISRTFGDAPTFMQNDGNLATLSEYRFGALQNSDPAIFMTISTGIGGGAVIGGKLFTGANGLAIEPGHMCIPHEGKIYKLEQLASGTALGVWARKRLAESNTPSLLRGVPIDSVDGKSVGEMAQQGDDLALDIVAQAGYWLGMGIVNLLHLFNPQAIALGGSVMKLGTLLLDSAQRAIDEHVLDASFYHADLIRAVALGEDTGLMGAAAYAQTGVALF
jgi:glucokinase